MFARQTAQYFILHGHVVYSVREINVFFKNTMASLIKEVLRVCWSMARLPSWDHNLTIAISLLEITEFRVGVVDEALGAFVMCSVSPLGKMLTTHWRRKIVFRLYFYCSYLCKVWTWNFIICSILWLNSSQFQ